MTTSLTHNQYTSFPYFYNNSASIIIKSTQYSRHHHHYGSCTPDSPMLSFCLGKISLFLSTQLIISINVASEGALNVYHMG